MKYKNSDSSGSCAVLHTRNEGTPAQVETKPSKKVLYLPENMIGRDFVIGDLHGMVPLLRALLDHVRFDPSGDRLFSVGDLIDRGEDSPGALDLLDEPWFHAVRGNHEDMLLDYLLSAPDQQYRLSGSGFTGDHAFLANGGGYWYPENPLTNNQRANLAQLPHILVVGKDAPGRFHVVHASLVKNTGDTEPHVHLFSDDEIDSGLPWGHFRYIQGYDSVGSLRDSLIWDRTFSYAVRDLRCGNVTLKALLGGFEALSPTYCGHTPVETPIVIGSHHMIDTGAFMTDNPSAGLSMVEIKTGQIFTANYAEDDFYIQTRAFLNLDREPAAARTV